jgi:hypothetical protein
VEPRDRPQEASRAGEAEDEAQRDEAENHKAQGDEAWRGEEALEFPASSALAGIVTDQERTKRVAQ